MLARGRYGTGLDNVRAEFSLTALVGRKGQCRHRIATEYDPGARKGGPLLSAEIGVAFVGCAHPHLPPRRDLLAAEQDVRLVGCFDPDPRLTKIVHERYGLRVFASATDLLDQSGVQLALVEGWDRDNPVYVREALKRGQAVLLGSPVRATSTRCGHSWRRSGLHPCRSKWPSCWRTRRRFPRRGVSLSQASLAR
jgi:hypothetical protein